MSQFVGRDNLLVLLGADNLSAYFNRMELEQSQGLIEATRMHDGTREYYEGVRDGRVVLSGWYDSDPDLIDKFLRQAFEAPNAGVLSAAPALTTIGRRARLLHGRVPQLTLSEAVDQLTATAATFQAADGLDNGVWLHALASETATANFASVDNTAATSNGGVGHLHVTAVNLASAATVTIQHSTDNNTWSNLLVFSPVAGRVGERLIVAPGTTVNRYLRGALTMATTSLTFALAFARR